MLFQTEKWNIADRWKETIANELFRAKIFVVEKAKCFGATSALKREFIVHCSTISCGFCVADARHGIVTFWKKTISIARQWFPKTF